MVAAVVIIGVLAFFMFLKIYGDPTAYTELEQRVEQYLTEEQGDDPDRIERIEVFRQAMKRPGYYVEVVFKDEPETVYVYCDEGGQMCPVRKKRDGCGRKGIQCHATRKLSAGSIILGQSVVK